MLGCEGAGTPREKAECFPLDCSIKGRSREDVRKYFEGEQLKLIFERKPPDPDNATLPNKNF